MRSGSKPHVVVLAGRELFASCFTDAHLHRLDRAFSWSRVGARVATAAVFRALARADALVTTWDSPAFDGALASKAPRVRIVAHCGAEVKARFHPSLFDRLVIANAPEPMARPVAEYAVTMLLYAARDIDACRRAVAANDDDRYARIHRSGMPAESTLLDGEVGLIGFGRIGRAIVDLLAPFRTRFVVFDPFVGRDAMRSRAVRPAGLDEVIRTSRQIVLAAALTPETRGMFDADRLAAMRDGAWLINVARGALIDLDALTREVLTGRLRCALDVTDPHEPLPHGHPLRSTPGAIVTPHIGAAARSVRWAMADQAIETLERFFSGARVRTRVTRRLLERMT